jgi:hypothetical protein
MNQHDLNITANTPYPELNMVLRELVINVHQILHKNFIGAYLQGSFAVGDFDEHSDCDFVMVTNRELSDLDVSKLQSMHRRIYGLGVEWAKHLEGSYFPKMILKDHAHCGIQLWYLNHGHKELVRSDHCNTAVVRWILREKGVILSGPKPSILIDPIPVDVLRREMYSEITEWGKEILANPQRFNNRFYQSFIVLCYCKMLYDLHTGEVGSKRAGAEWAKRHLDPSWSDLIDRTWAGRPNPAVSVQQPADALDFQRTLKFIVEAMCEAKKIAVKLGILEDRPE